MSFSEQAENTAAIFQGKIISKLSVQLRRR